jgi:NAD(P)-dependent dehydrogenase (short-subunit alcohol dehydrogenase family)
VGRRKQPPCDAANAADVAALAARTMEKLPRLDIAVTNIRKIILDCTGEDLDRVINLNIKGTVWFVQNFRRIIAARKAVA